MPGCDVKRGTPHECQGRWECGHGWTFPTHKPNGEFFYGTEGCLKCRRECEAAQAKLDRVANELGKALQ
jgi:hypothetical protein